MEKLVYIHIEKSAGTAQRVFFFSNCGKEHVYWYDKDSARRSFDPRALSGQPILGGHRNWSFYNSKIPFLKHPQFGYMAVIRQPVDRVISLYQYLRTREFDFWKPLGLDSNSLGNTLEQSSRFRKIIENGQCRYLSGTKSFEDTKQHIGKYKFLLSTLETMDEMNFLVAEKLGWSTIELERRNVGESGYRESLNIDTALLSRIGELVVEDQKLYEFVKDQKDGLYSSITDKDWIGFSATCSNVIP